MAITPEIRAEVLRRHSRNPRRFSPFRIAHSQGISTAEVLEIIGKNRDSLPNGREHNNGEGREDIQKFFVAKRRASDAGWDNSDPAIRQARADYLAGTHEMATHRDGAWLYLCSIPRQVPRAPLNPRYFTETV